MAGSTQTVSRCINRHQSGAPNAVSVYKHRQHLGAQTLFGSTQKVSRCIHLHKSGAQNVVSVYAHRKHVHRCIHQHQSGAPHAAQVHIHRQHPGAQTLSGSTQTVSRCINSTNLVHQALTRCLHLDSIWLHKQCLCRIRRCLGVYTGTNLVHQTLSL